MNDNALTPSEPWEQQPGEPNRWYARFERYRLAGPSRSLLGAVNAERQQRGACQSKSIPQAWAKNARQWRWRERAEAWDEHERLQARAARAHLIEEMNPPARPGSPRLAKHCHRSSQILGPGAALLGRRAALPGRRGQA